MKVLLAVIHRLFALLLCLSMLSLKGYAQPSVSVLDPADPMVEYNSGNPPNPTFTNVPIKWVRTKRLGWNTDSYKAYMIQRFAFRLKFPKTYQKNNDGKTYPIIIMFHGKGELGPVFDNEYQLYHGGSEHRDAVDNGVFDGYVLFMQNTTGDWGPSHYTAINKLLEYMVANNKLDINRVSVHGLSAGGRGAWEYTINNPKMVASALPMSAALPSYAYAAPVNSLKWTPIWTFQGGLDLNPPPSTGTQVATGYTTAGANFTYSLYADLGHGTWDRAYAEPNFFPFMLSAHKANPWVLYNNRTFCMESSVSATLGVTAGFDGYEWRKNGSLISGATSNTITVNDVGTYDVRIKRGSVWSEFSPIPAVVSKLEPSAGPTLAKVLNQSYVLPSPDGKTTISLSASNQGGGTWQWFKDGASTPFATTQQVTLNAYGSYTAKSTTAKGCLTQVSTPFLVVNANGSPKPDPAKQLQAIPLSETTMQLNWTQTAAPASQETGFEIYRATTSGGPYVFVTMTAADAISYTDVNLIPNTRYYYIVRAINNTGASINSNENSAVTVVDNVPPKSPINLVSTGTTESSISLSWTASTDNIGVIRYDIYQDGVKVGSSTTTTYTATGLAKQQGYNFYVVAIDASGNQSPPSNQLRAFAVKMGLDYKYYTGAWDKLPNFNSLTPVKTGRTNNVLLTQRTQDDNFAFLWEGYIKLPTSGTYTFRTRSDDGSRLYLSTYAYNATPLVDNDGLHGSQNRDGAINKTAGIYPISMTFFERGGDEVMEVWWKVPGATDFVKIPDSVFVDYFAPAGNVPATPTGLTIPTGSRTYKSLQLNWTDASNNETGFEIYRSTSTNGTYNVVGTVGANVTTFVDQPLPANTKYYYKIKAINGEGSSAFSNTANQITLTAPGAPAAPTGLTGQVLSTSSVQLDWTGLANTALSYGVYRSYDNSTFQKIGSVPGVTTGTAYEYMDNTIVGNQTLYYKVRAEHEAGNNSTYSNVVTLPIGNNPPVAANPGTVFNRTDQNKSVTLTATDPDNDLVTFSASGLPSFATLTNIGNNRATLQLAAGASEATYPVSLTVNDGNGGTNTVSFNIVINNNIAPVLSGVPASPYNMDEGEQKTISFSATDVDNDPLTWSYEGLPAFITPQQATPNQVNLIISPYYDNAGDYPVTVKVDDGRGGIATASFTIHVEDAEAGYHIYINFNTGTNNAQGGYWNNTNRGPLVGSDYLSLTNLKTMNGKSTPVGLSVPASGWTTNDGKPTEGTTTGNNSGVYPDNVMRSAWSSGGTRQLEINGLSPNFRYNLVFFSATNKGDIGPVGYTVNGQKVTLPIYNNTSNTATLTNLTADANGKLVITINQETPANKYNIIYINAMEVIGILQDNNLPLKPEGLQATATETGVDLAWVDKAFNEVSYQVYRSTSAEGPFDKISDQLPNSVAYTDASAEGNTTYYYYVAAVNGNGATNSDTVSVSTPNKPPVFASVTAVSMRVNQVKNINFSAEDTDNLTFSVLSMPTFASLMDNHDRTGRVVLSPVAGDEGTYDLKLVATDTNGGTDTLETTIVVGGASGNIIFVNLNPTVATNESLPYNNLASNATAGKTLALNDDIGQSTGIQLKLVDGWNATITDGGTTSNNNGHFTDLAMLTGIVETSSSSRTIQFTNLPANKKFTFRIYASRRGQNGTRNVTYTIGGQSVTLDAGNNIGKIAQLNEVLADASNSLTLTVSRGANNTTGLYLNAISIEVQDNDGKPTKADKVTALGKSRNQIVVNWRDNAAYEMSYTVLRSNSANGTYTAVATLPANTTTYTDGGLNPNTRYYYKIRANGYPLNSDLSNVAVGTTLTFAAYINFNAVNPAPAPWFNTNYSTPSDNFTWNNIPDETGANTGISLSITKGFTAVNEFGSNTGNNSGVYPDNVIRKTFWLDAGVAKSTLKLTGLNPNVRYSLTFFASRDHNLLVVPGNLTTLVSTYVVNGSNTVSVSLDAYDNTQNTITAYNVIPTGDGEVTIDVTVPAGSSYAYISSLVIGATSNDQMFRRSSAPGTDSTATVAALIADTDPSNQGTISAYPNPFTNQLNLQITTSRALENAEVNLYTLSGVSAMRRPVGNIPAGSTTVRVPVEVLGMQRGVYIVQVTDRKGFKQVIKVIKQ